MISKTPNIRLLRFISALLAALLLLGAASCGTKIPAETTAANDTTAPPSTEAAFLPFNISSDYVLVRPEKGAPEEQDAITLINRGLNAVTGAAFKLTTDWVRRGDEVKPAPFEILIGPTNRTQSKDTYNNLSLLDYKYEIVSENVIVICGGSPRATLAAARAFMKDVFGYEESEDYTTVLSEGRNTALTPGTQFTHKTDYPVKTLTLGGYPISDYKIVSYWGNNTATEILEYAFAELCGFRIPVVDYKEYKGGTPAIYLGFSDLEGRHLIDMPHDAFTYYITAKESAFPIIIIDTVSQKSCTDAAERFVSLYLGNVKSTPELNIDISYDIVSGIAVGSETSRLTYIKNEAESNISDGIIYTKRLYNDSDGKPVRAYVLTVAPGSGIFHTGTPEDGDVLLNKNATVLAEMNSAKANGKKVIAGINADFFDMGGTSLPRGLCIKDGRVLSGNTDRPWFAVLKDGTPVIGNSSDYAQYEGQIQTAVGGSHIMLDRGYISNIGLGTDFGYTRHPRTAVGIKADGSVVLIVVDGRQSNESNGASLGDLALIMRELGCTDAINLDGGGSSTFVTANSGSGFVTQNSPSGGALRRVSNSLLVLLPE